MGRFAPGACIPVHFARALAYPITHAGHYDDVFVSKFKKLMSVFPPDGTRTVYALRRSVN